MMEMDHEFGESAVSDKDTDPSCSQDDQHRRMGANTKI